MITINDIYSHIKPIEISYEEFKNKVENRERYLVDRVFLREYKDVSIKDYLIKNGRYTEDSLKTVYDFFFVNGNTEYFLNQWFENNVAISVPKKYLFFKVKNILGRDKIIDGRYNIKYSRLSKNLNLFDFYNTVKYDKHDGRPVLNLLNKINDMYYIPEFFTPSVFEIIKRKDYSTLFAYVRGATATATIFNPHTYGFILTYILRGEKLFTPVLAWNAYQHAFYNTNYTEYVGTDVIPALIENSEYLHKLYSKNLFSEEKIVKTYNCPSEKLNERYGFAEEYKNHFDSVLFSPPYFDLEIYPGEEQSLNNYQNYSDWLIGYWEETVKLCKEVLQTGGRFAFVISDYTNKKTGKKVSISGDMKQIAKKYFTEDETYYISWINFTTKAVGKNEDGNYENLFIFRK